MPNSQKAAQVAAAEQSTLRELEPPASVPDIDLVPLSMHVPLEEELSELVSAKLG